MKRYRTGKTARKRVIREIQKTGSITIVSIALMAVGGFFLLQFISMGAGNDREAAKEYWEKAEQYIKDENLRVAKAELKNAVRSDQSWPEARVALAEVQLSLFDAFGAKAELLHAKELGINASKMDHLLGKAHWLLGEYDEAKASLTNADIDPKHFSDSQRILGRVLIETGDIDGSRAAFDRALEKTPDNSMLWTDIARFRYVLGDQKGAIEAVDRSVTLDSKNIRALEFRGRMIRSQFGLLAALPWFERALEIYPDDLFLLTEYAATLGDAGRTTEMLSVTRDILEIDPKNREVYFMQATIAARARDYPLARRILSLAGHRQNNLPAGLLLSGIIEFELGNYNQAIALFRKLLQTQPHHKAGLKLLASGLYKANEYDAAYKAITRYIKRYGEDSYSNVIAARALEALDKRDQATKFLDKFMYEDNNIISLVREDDDFKSIKEQALKKPGQANIVIPYIRALLARENNAKALQLAKKLLKDNQGVADAHIIVGDIQIRNNNISTAVKHFNDARKISFEQPVMLRLVDGLRRSKKFDEAGNVLLSFLANNPRDLVAQKLIADNYMEVGDAVQAIFWLESILDRVGYNDTLILTKLSRSYAAEERYSEAVKMAKIAYDVNPASADATRVYGYVLMLQGENIKASIELLEKARKLLPKDKGVVEELNEAKALLKKPNTKKPNTKKPNTKKAKKEKAAPKK